MKLIKCYVENFGILHTQTINFSKGLNCCISENGTGKTTLTAFIEAMLYGIGDTRKQSLEENPRKKYSPWQGGKFGGSLTVEVGKKRYVIERSFGMRPADDTFRLFDADSGRESLDYGENIGESLFGIDRDGFLRTVFLSEKNLQGKNDNKTISAKLSDLVGVDGDVGGFDSALKLLEDRRKFYYKKGNTGEIANVKERINECQRKLDNVARLEGDVLVKEARLAELKREIARIDKVKSEQQHRLNEISKERSRSTNEEQYASMLATLNREKAKLDELHRFFQNGVPTSEQIDAARDRYVEAQRLKSEAMAENGDEEYVALSEYFKNGTSFVEISEMEQMAKRTEEIKRELSVIDAQTDIASVEMRRIFPDRVPTGADISGMEKAAKSSRGFIKALLLLLGLCAAAGGILLGTTVGYALAGVGLLISLFSVIFPKKSKNSKEMLALARQFNGCECSNLNSIIEELKEKLARYEALDNERKKMRETLAAEYDNKNLTLYDFLAKFPLSSADTVSDAVRIIRDKYALYYSMTETGAMGKSDKMGKLEKSDALMKSVSTFLANFPTVTDNPFREIRDRISDYAYATTSVAKMERECDVFAVRYGVTGKAVSIDPNAETVVDATLREAGEKHRAISEELTLITRELNLARAEIEKRDEYEMAKEELEELYHKHVESLEIIKKTAALLSEACDNITSKYLGKTKTKFEEYSKLITGNEGEYTLSTSFELTKTERGEAHGIDSYSRGTRDLYALSLRLALVDALYENEAPFIILDDPFIALDDTKLEKAKATLKALGKSKQILYFTCSRARVIE